MCFELCDVLRVGELVGSSLACRRGRSCFDFPLLFARKHRDALGCAEMRLEIPMIPSIPMFSEHRDASDGLVPHTDAAPALGHHDASRCIETPKYFFRQSLLLSQILRDRWSHPLGTNESTQPSILDEIKDFLSCAHRILFISVKSVCHVVHLIVRICARIVERPPH